MELLDKLNWRYAAKAMNKEKVSQEKIDNIIEAARMAREQGAIVIGVTLKDSPLAKHCNPVIHVPNIEDTKLFAPMVSRICQLAIVDILATGIAMEKGQVAWEHLKKIKQSVRSLRPPRETS